MKTVLAVLLATTAVCARTLYVPGADYPTIQTALDGLRAGDTVAVALGTYPEALHAPAMSFVMRGIVPPDTGDFPRPVIDPAPLLGSDSLRCMTIPAGASPIIEDIRFRNGPGMYPRHNWSIGGINATCSAITFRRCVFDSVYDGLNFTAACSLRIDQCHFLDVWQSVYSPGPHVFVTATDCVFSGVNGDAGWAHIVAYGGATLERCQFGNNSEGPQCLVLGNIRISMCRFGPSLAGETQASSVLQLYLPNGVVEWNAFSDLHLSNGFVSVQSACNGTYVLEIRHNVFVRSRVVSFTGDTGITVLCVTDSNGNGDAKIDSNLFEDNHDNRGEPMRGLCVGAGVDASANGNRFHRLSVDSAWHSDLGSVPVIWLHRGSTFRLGGNRFDSTGFALSDDSQRSDTVDARGNWWNDRTGPYQAALNPHGLGDTIVGDYVDFSGWCRDTSCTEFDAASGRFNLHPFVFRLSCFPNPFNSTTTLRLEVPAAEVVRIELYDILGRKVRELWTGAVSDEKEITLDGGTLASGVYFVRVTNPNWNRPLVSTKILMLK